MSRHWKLTPAAADAQQAFVIIDFARNMVHVTESRTNFPDGIADYELPDGVVDINKILIIERPEGPRSPEAIDRELLRRATKRSGKLDELSHAQATWTQAVINLLYRNQNSSQPLGISWPVNKPMRRCGNFAASAQLLNAGAAKFVPAA